MYDFGRFFVYFGLGTIQFVNKFTARIMFVDMKDPRASLLDSKRICQEQLYQMSNRQKGSSVDAFYRNELNDCIYLLDHLEDIQHLIIKHNL